MKEFKQSPYKYIEESVLIFFAASFFAFFVNYTLVDSIDRITLLEILASLGIGFGISVIFGIISGFNKQKIIKVTDNEIIISAKKTTAYKFEDLKALDTVTTFVLRRVGIVKVKIETEHRCIIFYVQKTDEQAFLNSMPEKILPSNFEKEKSLSNLKLNLIINLITVTINFLIFSVCILPAVLSLVAKSSVDIVWRLSAILYFLLLFWEIILFITRYIKYYRYRYNISGGKINITCGKLVKKSFYLNIENITAVYFSNNYVSRLFNLYKIKLLTRGSGKGLIETNYFPFMMNKEAAIGILENLIPKEVIKAPLIRPKKATIFPSLVIWLLPVCFLLAVSIIGSFLFLLLLIPIALFLIQTFKNSGRNETVDYYILQKGFLSITRIFIPVAKIERVDAIMTVTCRVLKMTYMEIYLSGYRAVVFGGYLYKCDFDNFVKNINELS